MGRITLTCPDEQGKEITIAELGAGHFFGELSLLDGGPRTATVLGADGHDPLPPVDRAALMSFLNQGSDGRRLHRLGPGCAAGARR